MTFLQDYLRTSPSVSSITDHINTRFTDEFLQNFIEYRNKFTADMESERGRLDGLGKQSTHITSMLMLVSEAYWDVDLIVAYSMFSGTDMPYVVRFVQQLLVDNSHRPAAHMMTQKHLDAYWTLDIAFSGPATEFAHRRDTREGSAFEKDILLYLFDNFDQVDAAALLIDRRAVQNMDEMKDALSAMRGVGKPLLEGAL